MATKTTKRPRKSVTRKRQSLRQKIGFAALIVTTALVTMGASCSGLGGSGHPIWEDPGAPARQVGEVIDAHKQAGKDVGNGAKSISDYFGEWEKGWKEADARREAHKAPVRRETPSPVPACDWSEFGPCDAPPPPEWFFADSNTNTE